MTQGMGLGMGGETPWGRAMAMARNNSRGSVFPASGFRWAQQQAAMNPNPVTQAQAGPIKADMAGVQQAMSKISGDENWAQKLRLKEAFDAGARVGLAGLGAVADLFCHGDVLPESHFGTAHAACARGEGRNLVKLASLRTAAHHGQAASPLGAAGAHGWSNMQLHPKDVFWIGRFLAKRASQDSSQPQRSSTGESRGLKFNSKPDDYAHGQEAWAATSRYFKGQDDKLRELMQERARILSPAYGSYVGGTVGKFAPVAALPAILGGTLGGKLYGSHEANRLGQQSQPKKKGTKEDRDGDGKVKESADKQGDIGPFAAAFLARCKQAGMSDEQILDGIDRIEPTFGKQACDELRDGMEKTAILQYLRGAARSGLNWGARQGARLLGRAAKTEGTAALRGAVGGEARNMLGQTKAPVMERLRGWYSGVGRAPIRQMTPTEGMSPFSRQIAEQFASKPQYGQNMWQRAWQMPIKERLGSGLTTGMAQGFAEPAMMNQGSIDPETGQWRPSYFSGGAFLRGLGVGALGGRNRALQSMYLNPMNRAGIAAIGGGLVDEGAGALGFDTGGYGRQFASLGAFGAATPWGRRAMGSMAPKVNQAILDFSLPRMLPKGMQRGWGRGAEATGGFMQRMSGGRVGQGLMRHGQAWQNQAESAASKWGRRALGGSLGLGLGAAGVGAMGNYASQRVQEFQGFMQQQGNQMIDNYLAQYGMTRDDLGKMLQQGKGMAGMGGMLSDLSGFADKILGMFGMDGSSMHPMQKMLILLGGGAMLGGMFGASGGMAGLGGLGLVAGLMGGFGGLGGGGGPQGGQGGQPGQATPMVYDPVSGQTVPAPQLAMTRRPLMDEFRKQQIAQHRRPGWEKMLILP